MDTELSTYLVLYADTYDPLLGEYPLAFQCKAESMDHAEEQCVNAYPDAQILWVSQGMTYEETLRDYWGSMF